MSNGRNEVGPAWDGFRTGAAEAECEIHGGFVTREDKIQENYKEWIKKNHHTDVSTLYPETCFVFPGRSSGKVLFTKAWMNAMYGTPIYSIKNVIFNDPATIVFWSDGTKTVVKAQEGETFDPEKGLAMAISKKALGNKREYYHTFLRWLKKYEKQNIKDDQEKKFDIKLPDHTNEDLCILQNKTYSFFGISSSSINEPDKTTAQHLVYDEKKHQAVQAAYDLLVKIRDTDGNVCLDEVIGYLGEALED